MIRKIVSGGQTGADRAALDVAIDMDIDHGGWVPRGRRTESGALDERYRLRETESPDYEERTRRNVRDADGTLILSHGRLSGGSAYTRTCARELGKPCLHLDLDAVPVFQAALQAAGWVRDNGVGVLNVAGPRDSEDGRIYRATERLLRTLLQLDLADLARFGSESGAVPGPAPAAGRLPRTVDEAVEVLTGCHSWQEKARMARMSEPECRGAFPDLTRRIRTDFRLPVGNAELMASCREAAGDPGLRPEAAEAVLLSRFLQTLRRTHGLRRIK